MRTTLLVTTEDGVARMVLNHPPHNILTREVLGYIRDECERLSRDPEIRVLLLTAEGKHFSAGADVAEHLAPEYGEMIPEFIETVVAIDSFPAPVIAAVHGRCLGGAFELVQAADMIVAADSAQFGQPEILLGVVAPAACVFLPRACPRGTASELIFAGDPISAREARDAGLVWRVVPDGVVERHALDEAKRIARHSGAALRFAKRTLRECGGESYADALQRAGQLYIDDLMATHDAPEGLAAFLEKRRPQWSHA